MQHCLIVRQVGEQLEKALTLLNPFSEKKNSTDDQKNPKNDLKK